MIPELAPGAMAGLRVIDLSRVLGGPYCTQILADHGADVVKVEPPAGDETRDWGPPFHEDDAAYFIGTNRNKRSIGLDLATEDGRSVLMKMLETADVLIENFKPGTLDKWGIGNDYLREKFPRLIHCRISGFGGDGPLGGLPGYDACAQAMGGLMSVNGEDGGESTRVGLPVVDMVTGLNAAVAILLALNERQRSGLGQFLDITLYDCALSLLHPHAPNYIYSGKLPKPTGNAHPNIAPYETLPTNRGPIFLAVGNNRQFASLARTLGAPALAEDPRFATNADRLKNRAALHERLAELLREHDPVEFSERLLRAGVPAAAVQNVAQALDHPHTAHRNMVWRRGDYVGLGTPIKLSRTPGGLRSSPPDLGASNDEFGW